MTGYHHVDVFADRPYTGNSLAVFVDPPPLDDDRLAAITRELRHFETIYVTSGDPVRARVFDLFEELDFAGHPVLGAAAVLHELAHESGERAWTFALRAGTVRVTTRSSSEGRVSALMDQGTPEVIASKADPGEIAAALGLRHLDDSLPLEIISTGLRYLIVPVRDLSRARIVHPDFAGLLASCGAQYAYLLDASAPEGRHWNNDGVVEDVATGSAAGCVAAYLLRHGLAADGQEVALAQGRFTGRPSRIAITAYGTPERVERVTVGGNVSFVGTATLRELP
ncbi:PhzF family phenazine biosynthesis protein [Nonomuraea sp. NPDC050536]|uniref:PhzF family phenazine biosynthesis protein n=1 Tax=Nonomuraea sp. NPDC050536 TaxID=3364366 RepID=UPI0037C87827